MGAWRKATLAAQALALVAVAAGCGPGAGAETSATESPTSETHSPAATAMATPTPTATVAPPTATPTPLGPRLLLPNLMPLPPDEMYIQQDETTGVRELRFSTLVANVGEGRLTMQGTLDPGAMTSSAVQAIDDEEGGTTETSIGAFVYEGTHNHWHFQDFMIFELWALSVEGRLDRLLATTGKLTFCIVDNVPVPFDFEPIDPNPLASECGSDLQGISVGWVDIYAADVPGQDIDIGGLPDGPYALRTRIDPDNRVLETDDSDNVDVTFFVIQGFEVELLTERIPAVDR